MKTAYLWEEILTPDGLTDILENYAQKTNNRQIWPRYHHLDVVRKLLVNAQDKGAGQKYLVQLRPVAESPTPSPGWHGNSSESNTMGNPPSTPSSSSPTGGVGPADRQTIRQFTQVASTVGHADRSGDLAGSSKRGRKSSSPPPEVPLHRGRHRQRPPGS